MGKIYRKNRQTAHRVQRLGRLGEQLACAALERCGFTAIQNLNNLEVNFPYGDILAVREGITYVISVKARNKFQANGKLNHRYKLGNRCYEHAAKAVERFGAVAAWITIPLSSKTYSVFFGELSALGGKKGVYMRAADTACYECLVDEEPHGIPPEQFENRYEQNCSPEPLTETGFKRGAQG